MEGAQLLAVALLQVVVDVDLFVSEGDAAAVLGLELHRNVYDGPTDARLAELRRGEEERDPAAPRDFDEEAIAGA